MTQYVYDKDISLAPGVQEQIARVVEQHLLRIADGGSGFLKSGGAVSVADALGLSIDASGNLVGNFVPRTGSLSSLLALDGGVGEISSATDLPAVVRHAGVAGEAFALMPFGAVRVVNIAATAYNFGAITIKPDVRVHVINPTGVGSGTVSISAGYFIGQPLRVLMLTGGGGGTLTGLTVTGGSTSISSNQCLDLTWNGTTWSVENILSLVGNGLLAFSVFGAATAEGDGSVCIGASASSLAAADNSIAIGPVTTQSPTEMGLGAGAYARKRYVGLSAVTTNATPKELTIDRNAATSANRVSFSTNSTILRVKAVISGKNGAGADIVQFVREAVIYSSGSTATIVSSPTNPTDVISGITGSPAAALGVTGNQLTVTVTGSTQTITWSALVEQIEMAGA